MANSSSMNNRKAASKAAAFTLLVLICIVMLLPMYIMLSTALKNKAEVFVFPPHWIPDKLLWHNFVDAMKSRDFGRYFYNSTMYSILGTFGEVVSSAVVAYGFARFNGKGRDLQFMILLSTMMIPYPVTMIPQFVLFKELGWTDSYLPLIVPAFMASAYTVFLLRQFFNTLPVDLFESAYLDGCGEFRTFWSIAMPLCKPAIASAAIFGIMWRWNDYLGPLIYLNGEMKYTVSIALATFTGMYSVVPWNWLMAASLIALMPPILLFFVAQKYFVEGIVVSGLK